MHGLFVTGTDTGVGKTVLSAALLATMAAAGEPVRAHKPVVTGLGEEPASRFDPGGEEPAGRFDPGGEEPASKFDPGGAWPADHVLLGETTAMAAEEVAPLRYEPAVSPHLAAQLAGERIDPARLLDAARAAVDSAARSRETLIVEGVGGLLTPLAEDYSVRDLAVALALPVLIAARPGLGTINHTLLTLEAARGAGLEVLAVVLTPWPEQPAVIERSNRETIARLGGIEVETLGEVQRPTVADLARVGAELPWRHWVGAAS